MDACTETDTLFGAVSLPFEGAAYQPLDQNWNGLRMTHFVIDQRCIHGPIHAAMGASLALHQDLYPLVSTRGRAPFDERLHLGGMRGPRVFFNLHTGVSEEFQQPLVSIPDAVAGDTGPQDCPANQRSVERLSQRRIVSPQADNEPVSPQFFDA